jgi:hypothetical protein
MSTITGTANIFEEGLIQWDVELVITELDNIPVHRFYENMKRYLETKLNTQYGGSCTVEGYIKPNSIKIVSVSTGTVNNFNVRYSVVVECMISCPSEGMVIPCMAQTITNGGIKAVVSEYPNDSPMVIFIAKELSPMAAPSISENDVFMAKIVGVHFELGDKYVSVIAKIFIE